MNKQDKHNDDKLHRIAQKEKKNPHPIPFFLKKKSVLIKKKKKSQKRHKGKIVKRKLQLKHHILLRTGLLFDMPSFIS